MGLPEPSERLSTWKSVVPILKLRLRGSVYRQRAYARFSRAFMKDLTLYLINKILDSSRRKLYDQRRTFCQILQRWRGWNRELDEDVEVKVIWREGQEARLPGRFSFNQELPGQRLL